MKRSDDELLDQLRRALVDPDRAPGPAELASFHRALASNSPTAPPPRRTHRRVRSPVRGSPWALALGVVVLAVLGAVGGGVAADSLPGPLRTAAYDVGLPVSSPGLVAAQAAEAQLRTALADHDRAAVVTASALLRQRLAALDHADREKSDPQGVKLLGRANAFLGTAPPTARMPGTGSTAPPPATTTPPGPTPSQPAPSTTEPEASAQPTEPSGGGGADAGSSGGEVTSPPASTTTPSQDSSNASSGDATASSGDATGSSGDATTSTTGTSTQGTSTDN